MTVREWDILCLFSGCVECNVTLPEIRKALAAVDMYVLPVVARGQSKGLTLPFQPKIAMDFYRFSFSVLKHRPPRDQLLERASVPRYYALSGCGHGKKKTDVFVCRLKGPRGV